MNKILLLFLTFIFGLLFLLLPPAIESRDWFLFSDVKLTYQTHIYFICEKLVVIMLAWIIAAEETKYKGSCKVFFWLIVADLLDYLLTYSSVWFLVGVFPVSMNVTKAFIFGFIVVREWIKQQR